MTNRLATIAIIVFISPFAFSGPAHSQMKLDAVTTSTAVAPPPGTVIDKTNASKYAASLPPGATLAIEKGFALRVVPSERIDWSGGFKAETEKYSAQVGLDSEDNITNYIAGMPFPIVGTTDPKAAVKIAYNWHMGPFMPDDFELQPWGSFAYSSAEASNSFVYEEWNSYICRRFIFLRYAHRTEVDPRPTLGTNEDGFEWKCRCSEWMGGPDLSPNFISGVIVRYLDAKKPDGVFVFHAAFPTKVRGVPDQRCRGCHQPFWAYALPKTEEYSYRLLGTTVILGCLTVDREPAGIVQHDNSFILTEEPFQLRNAYILEMTPKIAGFENIRTIVYVDSEAYVWLGAEFFNGSEQTEAAFPLWRVHPSASSGYLFDLAGEFYVPLGHFPSDHVPVGGGGSPKFLLRTLAPAHGGFSQKINTGALSENLFDPYILLEQPSRPP